MHERLSDTRVQTAQILHTVYRAGGGTVSPQVLLGADTNTTVLMPHHTSSSLVATEGGVATVPTAGPIPVPPCPSLSTVWSLATVCLEWTTV